LYNTFQEIPYELAALMAAQGLDLELIDEPGSGCCGLPLRSLAAAG